MLPKMKVEWGVFRLPDFRHCNAYAGVGVNGWWLSVAVVAPTVPALIDAII